MDIRLEFRYEGPPPSVRGIVLEMPDGADRSFGLEEKVRTPCAGGMALVMALKPQDGYVPAFNDLSRSRVLDVDLEDGRADGVSVHVLRPDRAVRVPMDTYSDRFPSDIRWKSIDRGARGMVRYFNNAGLPTEESCSGHPGTARKRFWIGFRADVTDYDVARFMDAHTQDGNHAFAANGMFCARYDRMKGPGAGISKTLQYTAPDLLDAAMDLSDWVADDMSGQPGHGGMDPVPWDRGRDAARIATANMDPATADALYRAIWKDHVLEDIRSRAEDLDEEPLTPEQEGYAADRYVYDGRYDCNLCYWDNIDNVIRLAREFA